MTDPIVISLQDLVTHHMTNADAWKLSKSDYCTEVQMLMVDKMIDYHVAAATLLLDTIKELKQYADHSTGSDGQPVTNSDRLGEGPNANN